MGIGLRWVILLGIVTCTCLVNGLAILDSQHKISALETRVQALEKRAGSCEVGPI